MRWGKVIEKSYRFITQRTYRQQTLEKRRLVRLPRYTPVQTNILGYPLCILDSASFLYTYESIFIQQTYRFHPSHPRPLIIDGGANIGLSTIFFKQNYPNCRLIAFEPDKIAFATLKKNLASFSFNDVIVHDQALWTDKTKVKFWHEGADAGRVLLESDAEADWVDAVRLRDYLTEPIDLLKLDVEGAETVILVDCADRLHWVEHLFVEYHSFHTQPQALHLVFQILHDAGFRVHIHSSNHAKQPFIRRNNNLGLDLVLNIYAFRMP